MHDYPETQQRAHKRRRLSLIWLAERRLKDKLYRRRKRAAQADMVPTSRRGHHITLHDFS